MTGMPLVLANLNKAAAHSRTCEILPGELSTSSVAIVCMESITTSLGACSCICVKIFSNDVSQRIDTLSSEALPSALSSPTDAEASRSARSLI